MNDSQKIGGLAALVEAGTFIVGIAVFATVLVPYGTDALDPLETVAFLAENGTLLYVWNQIIYLVFGIFLVVLSLALHQRFELASPMTVQTATAFGLIWAGLVLASGMVFNIGLSTVIDLYGRDPAQAASVWMAISSVQEGLGGGNEIVGGLWVLLISWVGLRAGRLPRALNYLGALLGVAGIVTIVPPLGTLGIVFGLGLIVWFTWLGIVMLRSQVAGTV